MVGLHVIRERVDAVGGFICIIILCQFLLNNVGLL